MKLWFKFYSFVFYSTPHKSLIIHPPTHIFFVAKMEKISNKEQKKRSSPPSIHIRLNFMLVILVLCQPPIIFKGVGFSVFILIKLKGDKYINLWILRFMNQPQFNTEHCRWWRNFNIFLKKIEIAWMYTIAK